MRSFLLALASVLFVVASSPSAVARPKKSAEHGAKENIRGLETAIRSELAATLPQDLVVYSIVIPESARRRHRSSDVVSIAWRARPEKGRAVVQVLVHQKNGKVKKTWARVELAQMGSVLVAAQDLPAGTTLLRQHLVSERRPQVGQEVKLQPSLVVGAEVVTDIARGDVIYESQVLMPLPVERGSHVQVVAKRGAVTVATRGILERATVVGTETRVRVAGKIFTGNLVRADQVELERELR